MRDLGLTLEEFNAAGEQGKRAADAVAVLRELPGYVGTSLERGRIVVAGSGPELQAKVDALNSAAGSHDGEFVLKAPASAAAPSAPAATAPAPSAPAAAISDAPAPTASAPASPTAAPELLATSTDQLYQAYLRDVGAAGLQAVAYANGEFIIRTGGINNPESGLKRYLAATAQPKLSASEFVSRYTNVTLEEGEPLAAEEDFFGGQGYYVDRASICSAGFSGFSPAGKPLLLTAGHCAEDGAAQLAEIEPPASSPSGGATEPNAPAGVIGAFGFSQFGGPNNSWITGDELNPGNVGTDIAVIESIRPSLNLQPAATQWDDPANLGAAAVKIVGTASPFQGQAVCRSGRTAGWSCGNVDEVGIYVVGGGSGVPEDVRAFRGFLSGSVQSSGGDSGGPWISGNFAVGTHSAGDAAGSGPNFAVATTLEDAMTRLPGVQLRLFLNKPVMTAAAGGGTVTAGDAITGQVLAAPAAAIAANSKVRITIAGQPPLEIPVDASGRWSFAAPVPAGQLKFSAETANGFSASGAREFEITVSGLPAPAIVMPTEDSVLTTVKGVEGTGTPGATVELSGDVAGSAVVGLGGHWSMAVTSQPGYGALRVTAVQTSPGTPDSPASVRNFTRIPPAPAVANIQDGQNIAQAAVPGTITGTGLDGATVKVLIDDAAVPQVPVDGGKWSIPFPAGLPPGAHTLAVSQTIDGATSAVATRKFTIMAPPRPSAKPPAKPPLVPPGQPSGPPTIIAILPAGDPGEGSGQLPDTGVSAVLPIAGMAGGALLIGGGAILVVRRRKRR